MKEDMTRSVDEFKRERYNNIDLVPKRDQTSIDAEIVKDQVIDLNDKFDYLLYILFKSGKLEENMEDFHFKSGQVSNQISRQISQSS